MEREIENINKIKPIKKILRFDYIRDIIIIPEKEEYRRNGIWWDELDYIEFKRSAILEVMPIIKQYGKITLHEALLILYNPNKCIELTKEIS